MTALICFVSKNHTCIDSDDLMIATIQSAGGVDDFLKELFTEMIQD